MEKENQVDQRKCQCKYCGCYFEPAAKHPHQECCGGLDCLRAQAREREHRCRKKRKKNPDRLLAYCQRKHREYIRRKERKRHLFRSEPELKPIPLTIKPSEMSNVILGMMQMITQEKDAEQLSNQVSRCRDAGMALRL